MHLLTVTHIIKALDFCCLSHELIGFVDRAGMGCMVED